MTVRLVSASRAALAFKSLLCDNGFSFLRPSFSWSSLRFRLLGLARPLPAAVCATHHIDYWGKGGQYGSKPGLAAASAATCASPIRGRKTAPPGCELCAPEDVLIAPARAAAAVWARAFKIRAVWMEGTASQPCAEQSPCCHRKGHATETWAPAAARKRAVCPSHL